MMKRFLPLFALLLILCLPSCVEEYPEPIYNPEENIGEKKEKLYTEMLSGVFYDFYSNMTAEASYYDPDLLGTSTVIPDLINGYRVTAIKEECFRGSKLTQITLPEGLCGIGNRAFYQTPLVSINLPDSVTTIGNEAFDNCRQLKKVTFGSGIEEIGTSAFYGCSAITEIDLSGGVKIIGEEAFACLSALKKLTLPDSLEEIGPYAFFSTGGEDLEIEIPKGVKKIGYAAFQNTALEQSFTGEWVILGDGVLIKYNGTSPSPEIPEEVKYLAWDFNQNEIESLTLPASLEGICPAALENLVKIPLQYRGERDAIKELITKGESA